MFYKGGSLASIEDPSEQEFIESNVGIYKDSHSSFWLGLYKSHKGTVTLSALTWKEIFSYREYTIQKEKLYLVRTNKEKYKHVRLFLEM